MCLSRRIALLAAGVSCLFLLACMTGGPQKTLNVMADALEKNDGNAFLAQMDTRQYAASQFSNMKQENRGLNMLDSLSRDLGLGGVDTLLGDIINMEESLCKAFRRGVSTGEMMADCRVATTPDCPWVPESLRKARVTELDGGAAVASVTTPAGMTSWLALRKYGETWKVVGRAIMEEDARRHARTGGTSPAPASPQKPAPAPADGGKVVNL